MGGGRTPTTTRPSLTAWSRARSGALQFKRTTPTHGASSSSYFNRTHGGGNAGYKAGEKVAIKANLNNTTGHDTIDRLNSSPHMILSLVRQLTGPGRVPQSSITVFDSSRFIPSDLYDKISP